MCVHAQIQHFWANIIFFAFYHFFVPPSLPFAPPLSHKYRNPVWTGYTRYDVLRIRPLASIVLFTVARPTHFFEAATLFFPRVKKVQSIK